MIVSQSSKEGEVECNLLRLWLCGRPALDLSRVIKILKFLQILSLLRAVSHLLLPRRLKKILIHSKSNKLFLKLRKFWFNLSLNHLKLSIMLKTTCSLRWENFLKSLKMNLWKKSLLKISLLIILQLLTLPISKFRSICVATKHSQQYPYKPAEFKAQCESKNPLQTTQQLNTLQREHP